MKFHFSQRQVVLLVGGLKAFLSDGLFVPTTDICISGKFAMELATVEGEGGILGIPSNCKDGLVFKLVAGDCSRALVGVVIP